MSRISLPVAPTARQLPRTHISYSAITTYQACPLRYFFRYKLGLREATVSSSLVLGGAIHAAVQLHFEHLLAGLGPPSLDTLLGAFWDCWKSREEQTIRFPRGEDHRTVARLAERMLRAFQRSEFARPAGVIIAVEEELRGPVSEGCPDLLARVDLVVDSGDVLVVSDLKTARSAWSRDHVLDAATQLWLYSQLIKGLADGRPLRLQFAVITKTAIPEVVLHQVPMDPRQIRRTLRIAERVWQAIEAGYFYPSPSAMNCPSCPYRRPCRDWSG